MKTSEIVKIVQESLPLIVLLVEGMFTWAKSGVIKKATVTNFLKGTVAELDQHSTGGQKNTWDLIAPLASELIDEAAAALPDDLGKASAIEALQPSQ